VSSRGLTGTISHLWRGFATTHVTSSNNPQRLLSAVSENRWVWWKEAAGAFSARPVEGWGAGSFPVLHLLYRHDTLPVQQPHDVPLQFLAETGVIGAILGIGAFVLLVVGGVGSVRRRPRGRDRLLAAALLASAVAYGVHTLFDWDWNILALSLPAFLFLGVTAGRTSRGAGEERSGDRGVGLRVLALTTATLWLCILALSVELPQLAADKATAALVAASSPSSAAVQRAQSEAALASSLDPLSDSGLLAEATVALHEGQRGLARLYLEQAVARNPSDPEAWHVLAIVDGQLGDLAAAHLATQRAVNLDPMGTFAQTVVNSQLAKAPPSASATHFSTPPSGG
jgi:tetratricopeptide (TPR) repeat protein